MICILLIIHPDLAKQLYITLHSRAIGLNWSALVVQWLAFLLTNQNLMGSNPSQPIRPKGVFSRKKIIDKLCIDCISSGSGSLRICSRLGMSRAAKLRAFTRGVWGHAPPRKSFKMVQFRAFEGYFQQFHGKKSSQKIMNKHEFFH